MAHHDRSTRLDVTWRVAVTREEGPDGPLSRALRRCGLQPVPCPVTAEEPPLDPMPLTAAARDLDSYDWLVCASVRAVRAVALARPGPWPVTLRTAAVGRQTAAALVQAGAATAPVTARHAGAEPLLERLRTEDTWPDRRVLVPAPPGGRRELIDGLRAAGARVDEVEAYRTVARPPAEIAAGWRATQPQAVMIASPSAAAALLGAVGADVLARLRAVVAIGISTAQALRAAGVHASVPERADFEAAADHMATRLASAASDPTEEIPWTR
jgi:uroporphyrinogen-III synthase